MNYVNDTGAGTTQPPGDTARYAVLELEADEALLYDCDNPRAWIWTTIVLAIDDYR